MAADLPEGFPFGEEWVERGEGCGLICKGPGGAGPANGVSSPGSSHPGHSGSLTTAGTRQKWVQPGFGETAPRHMAEGELRDLVGVSLIQALGVKGKMTFLLPLASLQK